MISTILPAFLGPAASGSLSRSLTTLWLLATPVQLAASSGLHISPLQGKLHIAAAACCRQ